MFMETYHKSMASLERRRALISGQFMLDMGEREEADVNRFHEEYNLWLSAEPLGHGEICDPMRPVERERKEQAEAPLVEFLTQDKHPKKMRKR